MTDDLAALIRETLDQGPPREEVSEKEAARRRKISEFWERWRNSPRAMKRNPFERK